MILEGYAVKLGDNIDTDVIIPGRYLILTEPEELAIHVFEGVYPGFHEKARKGVILVAGENFGCGSSREHAPIALKSAGVKCIIAKSYARIFYRNAVNIGLPLLESPEAPSKVDEGDLLKVDLIEGSIVNVSKGLRVAANPFPELIREIILSGGLIPYLKARFSGDAL
ncbi:MAG: 3-isopropylmalate dehydratase small subunit [Candidatus Bathyarchaeia archaeon]|nr:3-isopropylmalate dehydratase small subunit [Candidatus Bathyarchaeota archaeon]